jgi:hypothetical protein
MHGETGAFDSIVHRYSGRVMNGATCLAISGDDIDMTQIGFALAKHTEAFRVADVPYDPAIVVRGLILGKMFGGDEDAP